MPTDDIEALERQLARPEAKADLHGRTEALSREIADVGRRLDEIECGAGED